MAQRAELIADNTLVPGGHRLRFSKDNEFTSPSAAAAVIHGGAANGLTAWKSQGGKTLYQKVAKFWLDPVRLHNSGEGSAGMRSVSFIGLWNRIWTD